MHCLVIQTSYEERGERAPVGEIHRGFDLQFRPVVHLGLGVGLGPGDLVVHVRGLEDEHEVEGPEGVAKSVKGDDAREGVGEKGGGDQDV